MRIKRIIDQNRRDFRADFECEHCGHIIPNKRGYDDDYYHNEVIPKMECPSCEKVAADDYVPYAPKYPEGWTI